MKFVVLFKTPRKPRIDTAGSVSCTRLKIGSPSITAPSNRNARPAEAASSLSARYANATGPLLAVMTWAPAANPARTWAVAGSPDRMSRVVVSTITRASTPWERSREIHSSAEGTDAGPNAPPLARVFAARIASRPASSNTAPCRRVTMPTTTGSIPRSRIASRDSSSSSTKRRATFPNPTRSNASFMSAGVKCS